MALTKTVTVKTSIGDIEFVNAYHQIAEIRTAKEANGSITARVQMFIRKEQGGQILLTESNVLFFTYNLSINKDIYAQAYDQLKTLPKYSGAADA